MKLGGHRPGSSTSFVDAASGEVLLQVSTLPNGMSQFSFRLYDSKGQLVRESDGARLFPDGLLIEDASQELLLRLPTDIAANIEYRLYNSAGNLLTCSDGTRTQIFAYLRIDGVGSPMSRSRTPETTAS
jgi:hypothetical protein